MATHIDFNGLLASLKSQDVGARQASAAALSSVGRLGLNTVEALRALQAAADVWPELSDGRDTASELVWAAGRTPRRVYSPVITELFAQYGPKAKVEALRLLLRINERKATATWLELATLHAAQLSGLGTDALLDDPHHLDAVYPGFLALAAHALLAAEVCDTTCALLSEGLLEAEAVAAQGAVILEVEEARRLVMERLRGDQPGQGWERQAEYLAARSERTAALDLIGWFPGAPIEAILRRALGEPDRRVKAFALAALIRRDAKVEPGELAEVAADLELRSWLKSRLAEVRHGARLPDDDASQS